jgi:tetratricopeptide (TPR) repeat protein
MRLTLLGFLLSVAVVDAQVVGWDTIQPSRYGNSRESSLREPFSALPLAGTISGASQLDMGQLRVELVDLHSRMIRAESVVSSNGVFSFGSIPMGNYELRVVNLLGGLLYAREVNTSVNNHVVVVLTATPKAPVAPISLRRLQHVVPKPARKKMEQAEKLFRQGKKFEALQTVRTAVELDPEYFEALANLGALELVANEPAKALPHLTKALEIEPSASLVAANLAATHLLLGNWTEAEAAARHSLRHDSRFSRSRFLLAMSLFKQDRVTPEAIQLLEVSQVDFPPSADLLKVVRPQLMQQ